MTTDLRLVESSDWASLLEEFPSSTVFHTSEWLETVGELTGTHLIRLAVFNSAGPIFLFPLFLKRVAGMRALLSPPPGLAIEYLGPLYNFPPRAKRDKREAMAYESTKLAIEMLRRKFQPTIFYVRTTPAVDDVRPWQWLNFDARPLYTYDVDLRHGPEAVLSTFKRELRNDLGRVRNRLQIEEAGPESIELIHRFVTSRFRSQELSFDVPDAYVHALFNRLWPRNMRAMLASSEGEPVAGVILTVYNRRVAAWIGARSPHRLPLPVMDALFWSAIQASCSWGADVFELMGANVQRISAFKVKYNATLSSFFQLQSSGLAGWLLSSIYHRLH